MNGLSTVPSLESWIGINRIAIYLAGSGRTNAGTISVTASVSGFQLAQMPVGTGVSQALVFYVPDNHQFLVRWLDFDCLRAGGQAEPEITFRMQVYSAVNNAIQEVYRGYLDTAKANHIDYETPIPLPIGERSIIYLTATTTTNNTSVSGRMSGELFRNVDA